MSGTRIGQQQLSAELQRLGTRVDQLSGQGPEFRNPVSRFVVSQGPNHSVQIQFRFAFTLGIDSIHIHRNGTRDFGSAKILTTITSASFASSVGGEQANTEFTYTDVDATLQGTTQFYWLHIIPKNPARASIVHGPQLIAVA